jgi:hypothetical protein
LVRLPVFLQYCLTSKSSQHSVSGDQLGLVRLGACHSHSYTHYSNHLPELGTAAGQWFNDAADIIADETEARDLGVRFHGTAKCVLSVLRENVTHCLCKLLTLAVNAPASSRNTTVVECHASWGAFMHSDSEFLRPLLRQKPPKPSEGIKHPVKVEAAP